jgi:hypothetical protein
MLDAVSSADAAGVAAAVASDEVPSLLAQAPVGVGAGNPDGRLGQEARHFVRGDGGCYSGCVC